MPDLFPVSHHSFCIDLRSAQLNLLQQQHAALESRRILQNPQLPQQQNLSPFPAQNIPGFLPHASFPLWGSSAVASGMGMHPALLGAGGRMPNLTGSGWDPSLAGLSGFGGADPAMAMSHQFPFSSAGAAPSGAGNPGGASEDSGLASLGFMSASGRQLLMMQQALAGGSSFGILPNQGQFLGGMPGFGMADPTGFAQGFMPGAVAAGGRKESGQVMTDAAPTLQNSSMTPAGISHQALYARDAPEEENDSVNKQLVLYMQSCDDDSLSAYQCLVRKQIELFDAKDEDVESNAQGRNKPIIPGQVGIRCRHCSRIPPRHRTRGATYYPAKLNGLYQAAQNMASAHLCNHCQLIPDALRQELIILRDRKSSAGGGKQYWADGVRVLGVVETNDILRFEKTDRLEEDVPEEDSEEESSVQVETKDKTETAEEGGNEDDAENSDEELTKKTTSGKETENLSVTKA